MRPSGRKPGELRAVKLQRRFTRHAENSVLVEFGDTRERLCRMERRAAIVIGTHGDAKILDRGGGQLACETTDAVIRKLSLAAVMREVMHHQRSDVGDQIERSADAFKK